MSTSSTSLALTMKDAAKLVGVDYRTIKLGIESGTIPTVQLGPRRMIPRVPLLRASASTSDSSHLPLRHSRRVVARRVEPSPWRPTPSDIKRR
jgi:excisionase family DNA binding protein